MPLFDELNATTKKVIWPAVLADLAFRRASPFWAYLKANAVAHLGGAFISQPFVFNKTTGGPYSKGQSFDTTKAQYIDASEFDIKYYEQNVTEFLEEIDVEATGPENAVDLVTAHTEIAMMTMNENLAIEAYHHGQPNASLVTDNRVESINGFEEIINNGTDNAWTGNVFTTYGKQTRSTLTGFQAPIFFVGDSTGAAGAITYGMVVEQAMAAAGGQWEPDLWVGGRALYSFVLERIQPQQRFGEEQDVVWGARAFRVLGMKFMRDDYAPGSKFGANDPKTGNFLTSTFTSVASPTAASGLPSATTITVGETSWMLNTHSFDLKLAKSELFRFGWTGFKWAQNSSIVAGQVLAGLNILCRMPWTNTMQYGINS